MLKDGVQFFPHFPLEPGVRYYARFDPRLLAYPELSNVATLEFSLPGQVGTLPTHVQHVFPSSDLLPENLLRFYVCFSNSMQRGRAEEYISLLDPNGRPVPDVLYRPPVELWDRTMRHLTVLLDPGRLKRGVGPNRELGPPLKAGQEYTFVIGSGILDLSGRPLRDSFYKRSVSPRLFANPSRLSSGKSCLPQRRPINQLYSYFRSPWIGHRFGTPLRSRRKTGNR
jgi:hypothetical protein